MQRSDNDSDTNANNLTVTFIVGPKTRKQVKLLAARQKRTEEDLVKTAFLAGLETIQNMYEEIEEMGPPKYACNPEARPGPRSLIERVRNASP